MSKTASSGIIGSRLLPCRPPLCRQISSCCCCCCCLERTCLKHSSPNSSLPTNHLQHTRLQASVRAYHRGLLAKPRAVAAVGPERGELGGGGHSPIGRPPPEAAAERRAERAAPAEIPPHSLRQPPGRLLRHQLRAAKHAVAQMDGWIFIFLFEFTNVDAEREVYAAKNQFSTIRTWREKIKMKLAPSSCAVV